MESMNAPSASYTIDADYEWFKRNRPELFRRYPNRFLVIRDQTVLGDYPDMKEAVESTRLRLGQYLLQECLENAADYVVGFHSPGLVLI